ncbi:Tn3 family transposase (plasmid) [Sulfurimonas aquatica]|uniref:Tn3 family transposase n=1 Tax=Sulfurimonas aquatica TaxID=2672570 RepID=A0A975B2W2_9BACT|nr:Tn3 family transposase [Sulfurimonas aquatica]QSZ43184.1 Tn3 family transposase [Sulfurimonas aquatica]
MPILSILSKVEQAQFESEPSFSLKEKNYFFKIPQILLSDLNTTKNKVLMTLLWGYFKAKNKFYMEFSQVENLKFLRLLYNREEAVDTTFALTTTYRYKEIIKTYLGIHDYTQEMKSILQKEANNLANNFIHRKKIFYTLVALSKKLNIEVPSYTELTRIISTALNTQKSDILFKLEFLLHDDRLKELDEFLVKEKSSKNRYKIAYFRKLEHATTKNKMLLSLGKFKTIQSKFTILKEIIETVGITPKIAQYYAKWIEKSQTSQINQTNKLNQKFTLLSFIYHQYLIRNDNLIDRFISTVQTAKNSSFRAQKEFSFELEPQKNKIIQSLEEMHLSLINEMEFILSDVKLSAPNKVLQMESLLETQTQKSTQVLNDKKVLDSLIDNKYEFIEKKSISLQGKLSGILKAIEFDEANSNKNIIAAINYFKNSSYISSTAPKEFLDEEERITIFESGKFRVSLYKVLLFFHVSDAIKNGTLNLKYSLKYRNFEDYLIDKEEWKENNESFIKVHELGHLKKYEIFIAPIKGKLESSFKESNRKINKGFNSYFTSTESSFILKTPKLVRDENEESISKYFPAHEYISVIDLLHSINEEVDFLSSFHHYNQSKSKSNHNLLLAALLGYGCNLSLPKIGKISKGINENQLDNIKTWYLSEENTDEANNKIISFMDTLEIVKVMRADQDINHTSSDGQKYNISQSIDSTNTGYSFKYFGTDKGVVAYTFLDESHRLFHSQVINVNERESGYVIDGLMHNNAVKSDIHSTDTHGFTEVIFGLTNLLGFSFAPRIKNFKDQQLYGCNSPKHYHNLGYKLTPKRKINEKLISDNWDEMLRFIVTIKECKTTATQLLKRLTSYSRQHKLYTALKEYGKIIKTDFLLNYIDDVQLRQRIEKQLNKVEASNKFSKAVFFGNSSEFTVATVEEQNIANNSKRLIQNAIILWNYMFITKKIQQAPNQKEKAEIITALKNSSIVHWSHINFYGEYDFTRSSKRIHRLIALDETKGYFNAVAKEK